MQTRRFTIALAGAMLLAGAQSAAAPVSNSAGLPLALDGASLKASKTASGFSLSGQADVSDPCHAARFVLSSMRPLRYDLVQFRRLDKIGVMCIMRTAWVTAAPLAVATVRTPAAVIVRTQKTSYSIVIQ